MPDDLNLVMIKLSVIYRTCGLFKNSEKNCTVICNLYCPSHLLAHSQMYGNLHFIPQVSGKNSDLSAIYNIYILIKGLFFCLIQ